MDRLNRMLAQQGGAGGGGMGGPPADAPQVDTSEQIYISSLALLKMLKHGALPPLLPKSSLTYALFVLVQPLL